MPRRRASSRVCPSKPTSAKKRTAPATIMLSRSAGLSRCRAGAAAPAPRLPFWRARFGWAARRLLMRRSLAGFARIGGEAGGVDAGTRAHLVLVGGGAGDADGADHVAVLVADQHAAGIRHHTPAAGADQRRQEGGILQIGRAHV